VTDWQWVGGTARHIRLSAPGALEVWASFYALGERRTHRDEPAATRGAHLRVGVRVTAHTWIVARRTAAVCPEADSHSTPPMPIRQRNADGDAPVLKRSSSVAFVPPPAPTPFTC
jgi:hypothetical protein